MHLHTHTYMLKHTHTHTHRYSETPGTQCPHNPPCHGEEVQREEDFCCTPRLSHFLRSLAECVSWDLSSVDTLVDTAWMGIYLLVGVFFFGFHSLGLQTIDLWLWHSNYRTGCVFCVVYCVAVPWSNLEYINYCVLPSHLLCSCKISFKEEFLMFDLWQFTLDFINYWLKEGNVLFVESIWYPRDYNNSIYVYIHSLVILFFYTRLKMFHMNMLKQTKI